MPVSVVSSTPGDPWHCTILPWLSLPVPCAHHHRLFQNQNLQHRGLHKAPRYSRAPCRQGTATSEGFTAVATPSTGRQILEGILAQGRSRGHSGDQDQRGALGRPDSCCGGGGWGVGRRGVPQPVPLFNTGRGSLRTFRDASLASLPLQA